MRNLLTMDQLSIEEINVLIDRAIEIKNEKNQKNYAGKKIANLFFEPSTRTHYSFISAQHNLNIESVNFEVNNSSLVKGESLYDTVKTFEAIGMDALVIRHSDDNYFEQLTNIKIPIMNGGDGSSNHPTQCLLDLMTIKEEFGSFEGLKVVIVGDIKHSRVAHSNIATMTRLGMDVSVSAPSKLQEDGMNQIHIDEILHEVDVIMLLRVQFERHSVENLVKKEQYNDQYGMNIDRMNKTKDNTIIMHPAPFNRGIEITDEIAECEKSRIFQQMENGVYTRMAVMEWAFEDLN